MTPFAFKFVPYRRPFVVPLRNARGDWYEREGILVRLEAASGAIGYGEVAPLPEFGTETLEEARRWCADLGESVTLDELEACPRELRCCRFALGSALAQTSMGTTGPVYRFRNCALLPTGDTALEAVRDYSREGFRTFKLKIGVDPLKIELALVDRILSILPAGGRLRLDANEGLEARALDEWQGCFAENDRIEYLEQPLRVGREAEMAARNALGRLPLALDESVASVDDLERALVVEHWDGPIVVKASILGSPAAQLNLLGRQRQPLIFSSVFETAIGLDAVLRLAARVGVTEAVGLGTLAYFEDGLSGFGFSPEIRSDEVSRATFDAVWETVCDGFVLS